MAIKFPLVPLFPPPLRLAMGVYSDSWLVTGVINLKSQLSLQLQTPTLRLYLEFLHDPSKQDLALPPAAQLPGPRPLRRGALSAERPPERHGAARAFRAGTARGISQHGVLRGRRNRAQVQENGDFLGFKPENWIFHGSLRAMNCILSTNS